MCSVWLVSAVASVHSFALSCLGKAGHPALLATASSLAHA